MSKESVVKTPNKSDPTHKVFKNDPKYFKSLINKTVKVTTSDGTIHNGKVYVVDPVSESVVIIHNDKEKCNVIILLGHAIKSIEICDTEESTENAVTNSITYENNETMQLKKAKLKSWLSKNLINVVEDGMTLKLGDDLIIEPPYEKEFCFSSNTIILQRVQEILVKMPNNE